MKATRFNHVSVRAIDLETSVRWYEELFGVTRLPAPNFGIKLAWLELGDMQLHIFERDCESNRYSHFGLDVDDFEAVYLKAKALNAFDRIGYYSHHLFETPAGELQLYLRDPAGNLLEVNWPNAATIDRTVVTGIVRRADLHAQSEENLAATLSLGPPVAAHADG